MTTLGSMFKGGKVYVAPLPAGQPLDLISLAASLTTSGPAALGPWPLGNPNSLVATLEAWTNQDDDAHEPCSLTACRHPLHPGPCKGWKGTLHQVAPGTYKQIEEERVRKANDRRIKRIADLKAQGKPIPRRLLTEIKAKPAPTGQVSATAPGKVNQQADLAGGQAHHSSQAISNAAGVKPSTPLPLGPKGKKPAITKRGPAFVITQPKVTDQYKLDKAAKITPQEWDALPAVDKNAIRNELTAIKARGFGPQQTKADALLAKLPAPNTVGNTAAPKAPPTPSVPAPNTPPVAAGTGLPPGYKIEHAGWIKRNSNYRLTYNGKVISSSADKDALAQLEKRALAHAATQKPSTPAPGKVTLGQATKTTTPQLPAPAPSPTKGTRDSLGVLNKPVPGGAVTSTSVGLPNGYRITRDGSGYSLKHNGKLIRTSANQGALEQYAKDHAKGDTSGHAPSVADTMKTPAAPPGTPANAPAQPAVPAVLSPDAQQARAIAGRATPRANLAKTQIDAYSKLSATDFGHLDARTQRTIRDDLANAKAKFLDPKKQQAAQDLLDRFGSRHPTPATSALPPSASSPTPAAPSGGRKVYTATYNGKTITRTSNQPYTHASVVRWSDGTEEVASFHNSEAAALKGVLTAQQKQNGAQVVKAVSVKVDTPAATGAKGYSDPMNEAVKAVHSGMVGTDDTLKAVGRLSPATVGQLTPADKKAVLSRLDFVATHPKATLAQKTKAAALKRIIESGSPAQTSRTWDHAPTLSELHTEEQTGKAKLAVMIADALKAADTPHAIGDGSTGKSRLDTADARKARLAALGALSKAQFDALTPDEKRKITDALQGMHVDQKGQYGSIVRDADAGDLITEYTGMAPGMARLQQAEADFRAGKIDGKGLHRALLTARVQSTGSAHAPGSPGDLLAKEATRIARDNPTLPLWLRSEMIDNPYGAPNGLYGAIAMAQNQYNWEPAPRLSNGDLTAIWRPTAADLATADPIHADAIRALRLHLIQTGLKGDPGVPTGSPWSLATRNHVVDNILHISSNDLEVPQERLDEFNALPRADQVLVRKVLADRILSQTDPHAKTGTEIALRQLQGFAFVGEKLDAAKVAADKYGRPDLDVYRKLTTADFQSLPMFTQTAIKRHLAEAQGRAERGGAVRTWTPGDNALKEFPAALAAKLDGSRPNVADRRARNASDVALFGTGIVNPLDRVRVYGDVPIMEFRALDPATHSRIISDLDAIATGPGSLGLRYNALFTKDLTLQQGTGLNLDQLKAIGAVHPGQPLPDSSAANYLHDLDKADFDSLDKTYRDAIDERIKSLPGTDQQLLNAKFHPAAAAAQAQASPAGVTPTTGQANVPPHVQTALDVIYGTDPKSHTMARQLSAYGALRGSDFTQLNPQEQNHLLSDLSFIHTTAKGPSAAKAKLLIDRFTPAGTPSGTVPTPPVIPPANSVPGQVRYATPLKGTLVQAKDKGTGGDGWTVTPGGKRVWGKYGAAGLLLMHQDPTTGERRYLMVQRGPGISDPGKWQFPGGAIDSKETFHQGGTREVIEELGFKADALKDAEVHGEHTNAIPGSTWKYVSVAAQVPQMLKPDLSTHHARMETSDAQWMTEAEIKALDTSGKLLAPLAGGKLEQNVLSLFPQGTGGGSTLGQAVRPGPVSKRLKRLTLPVGGRQAPAQFNAWPHPHKPSKGKNLVSNKADIDAQRQKIKQDRKLYDGKTADGRLAAIGAQQGFDDTPTVVEKKEIDRLLATGDYIEAWRGVSGAGGGWSARSRGGSGGKTAAQINEEMRTGPAYYGTGIFGNGYYLATQKRVAEQYSDHTRGSLVRMLIPKSAVMEKYDKVEKEAQANSSRISKAKGSSSYEMSTFWDPGRWGAAKGLDGIEINPHHRAHGGGGAGHVASHGKPAFNWLNRSVLIIQKEPG